MKRIFLLALLVGLLYLFLPRQSYAVDYYYADNGKCVKTTTEPTATHWLKESECIASLTSAPSTTYTGDNEYSYKINDLNVYQQPELISEMYKNPATRIDGNTPSVWVTFTGLVGDRAYYVCGSNKLSKCTLGNSAEMKADSNGVIIMNVCGNGTDNIKGTHVTASGKTDRASDKAKIKEECKKGRDYFHEGETYAITVFDAYIEVDGNTKVDIKNANLPFIDLGLGNIISAQFFVAHSYPIVRISSSDVLRSELNVTMWGRRPGDGNDNNYQVVLEGTDHKYKKERCFQLPSAPSGVDNLTVGVNTQWVPANSEPPHPDHIFDGTGFSVIRRAEDIGQTKTFGSSQDKANDKERGPIGKGLFLLKVNERVSDNRPLNFAETCEGGHTFMHIFFRVGDSPKATNGIEIVKVIYDPNDADGEDMQDTAPAPPPPCAKGALDKDTGICTAFNVALLGKVQLEPLPFIKSVYTIVLSIAGLAAVVIIIRAGYKLMYSRGDKEMIADARSHITSAIIGLLFIIFAYVILSIIGVDILKIPGFS